MGVSHMVIPPKNHLRHQPSESDINCTATPVAFRSTDPDKGADVIYSVSSKQKQVCMLVKLSKP